MKTDRSPRRARRLLRLFAWTMLTLAASACGNVTAGGFTEVDVYARADAPDPTALLAPALAETGGSPVGPLPSAHDDAEEAEGEVEIDFRPALVSETGAVVSLSLDDVRIRLDLQGPDDVEAVNAVVPAGRYTALRLTFTHIQVEVSGGLIIDGQPIVGEIRVELEDPELAVSRSLDIEAVEGGRVELLVDLNTPAWLAAVDPATRTIDATVFATLIDAVIR